MRVTRTSSSSTDNTTDNTTEPSVSPPTPPSFEESFGEFAEAVEHALEQAAVIPAQQAQFLSPSVSARDAAMSELRAQLNEPLDTTLTRKRRGYGREKDGQPKMLDYLEWHTVTRQLNRLFGPNNWSWEVKDIKTFGEDPTTGIPRVVTATASLTVEWPNGQVSLYTNNGVEVVKGPEIWENGKPTGKYNYTWEAFEMAYKGAAHDAFKRAATALGDQFGLSLYVKEEETKSATSSSSDVASTTSTTSSTSTTSTTAASSETRQATTPSFATASSSSAASSSASLADEYDPEADEVAHCEECDREIRGYRHKTTGRVYTTADLVNISRRNANGRVLCYTCREKARRTARRSERS